MNSDHTQASDNRLDRWKDILNIGPMPTPEVMREYEQLQPGTAKRFIDEYFNRLETSSRCLVQLVEYKENKTKAEREYKLTIIDLEKKYRSQLLKYNIGVLCGLVILGILAVCYNQQTIALGIIGLIAVETIRTAIRPPMLL